MPLLIVNTTTDGRTTFKALSQLDESIHYLQCPAATTREAFRKAAAAIHEVRPTAVLLAAPEDFGRSANDVRRLPGVKRLVVSVDRVDRNVAAIIESVRCADALHIPTRTYADELLQGGLSHEYPELAAVLRCRAAAVNIIPYGVRRFFVFDRSTDSEHINAARKNAAAELRAACSLAASTLPIVSVVARQARMKGLPIALPAMRHVVEQKLAQAVCWLNGNADDQTTSDAVREFQAFADANSRDVSFRVTKSSPRKEELLPILHASDVVLFPSMSEPQGVFPLEAMGAGALVLGTPTGILGDLRDQVYGKEHAHLLVEASSENALATIFAERLEQLCRDVAAQTRGLSVLRERGIAAARSMTWEALLPEYKRFADPQPGTENRSRNEFSKVSRPNVTT